jgi:hypothetical protein
VGTRVAQAFDVGHLGALFGSFAIVVHLLSGEINHEAH